MCESHEGPIVWRGYYVELLGDRPGFPHSLRPYLCDSLLVLLAFTARKDG